MLFTDVLHGRMSVKTSANSNFSIEVEELLYGYDDYYRRQNQNLVFETTASSPI